VIAILVVKYILYINILNIQHLTIITNSSLLSFS